MKAPALMLSVLSVCAGCAFARLVDPPSAPASVIVPSMPAPVLVPTAAPVPAPTPAPSPVAAVPPGTPSPAAVLADSATTQAAANRYVAWSKSRPENINRLTVLNAKVNSAIRRMQTYLHDGHYDPARVLAARQAVDALRDFLVEKSD